MSGVAVIFSLLGANPALGAVVPASHICSGELPQGVALPAIALNEVSRTERHNVGAAGQTLVTARIQATAMAKDYATTKQIVSLIGGAVPNTSGVINGVTVDRVLRDVVGPDFSTDEPKIYMQTRDFKVMYYEQH